jgi:general stress protein YciG
MANHRGGSGNFAEDRERASEAGRKGGQHSGGNFKMTLSAHQRLAKRVKTATAKNK